MFVKITDEDLTALVLQYGEPNHDTIRIRGKVVKLPFLIKSLRDRPDVLELDLRSFMGTVSHWEFFPDNTTFFEHENGDCYILQNTGAGENDVNFILVYPEFANDIKVIETYFDPQDVI